MTFRQWLRQWSHDAKPWDEFGWNHWRYESHPWSGWEYLFRFTIGAALWLTLWVPFVTVISLWRALGQQEEER